MSTNYSPELVTDGLTLCLDANAVSSYPGSGSTWYDISGNDLDVTQSDGTLIPTFNSAGYFDFTSDRMEHWTTNAPGINGAFTVCGWISPDSFTSPDGNPYLGILNRSDGTNHVFSLFLGGSGGSYGSAGSMAAWAVNTGGAFTTYTSSSTCIPTLAEWNFCVWRYQDGAGMTFDLFDSSGHVTNTQSTSITLQTDIGNQFTLGGWRSVYYFDGKIANLAQYFRRLSDAEVQQNFNAHRSRFRL